MNHPSQDEIGPSAGNEGNPPSLTSGSVLLAREVLLDPNFEATVVLVCVHSPEGTYGLVLNRISHMPLSEIFDGMKGMNLSREILIGGPVQQTELQMLQITDTPAEGAYPISPGIYMGGKWETIDAMISADTATTRLFLGYSGWGPGQLDAEIRIGAWDIYNVDIKLLIKNCHFLTGADHSAISSFLQSISL